ncbi:MAG: HAMP domain-containing protein [Clostridioides difficile]|nr:HAMP domain-containing protein [Clostridioides difficile]
MSYDLTQDIWLIGSLVLVLFIIEGVITLISLVKVTIKTKKILRPIDDMNRTVKEITINNIDTRLNILGSQNELKDLANTFNEMLDRIQESYETQNQFVSDASHELRTPLTVIQGYARMLNRWGKDDKAVLDESITAIESESESMKALIEQLLFLARGDKNTQRFSKDIFKLNDLIDNLIKESNLIDEGRHIIKFDVNDPININADRSLLKEALRVFIDNSIKYTKYGGEIILSSYVTGDKATIVIKDTGIGMSKEDLPKIFDRFYRADKSRTRETGGTGLGLSIAKWIINKHGGTIDVTSKIDVGTTFMLKIPIE